MLDPTQCLREPDRVGPLLPEVRLDTKRLADAITASNGYNVSLVMC